jgi:aerobic-type carbon monoxide dehydrogenase small subunit (CoxS/CutS family)
MTRRYRFLVHGPSQQISVNGRSIPARQGASLLATLLNSDEFSGEIPFYCGIGQCSRCNCQVDGVLQRSCMYYPTGGEHVELVPADQRESGPDQPLHAARTAG